MRTASAAYQAAVAAGRPLLWRVTIDGTAYRNRDMVSGSVVYRAGVMPAGRFEPGGAVISSFSFALRDPAGAVSIDVDDAVTIEAGYLIDGVETYIPYASMTVSEVTPSERSVAVRCLDRLAALDDAALEITYPTTVLAMVQAALSGSGITLASTDFIGADFPIKNPGSKFQGMTKRQALAYCMQMTGQFCRVNSAGQLVIGWFNSQPDYTLSGIFSRSCTTGGSYTGIRVAKNGQKDIDTTITGEEGCVYVAKGNPLISSDNVARVKSRIGTNLIGLWFSSGTISILSNPLIEPGDMARAQVFREQVKNFPICSVTLKGSTRMDVSCEAAENCLLTDTRQRDTDTVDSEAYQLAQEAYDLASQGGGGGAGITYVLASQFDPAATYPAGTLLVILDG